MNSEERKERAIFNRKIKTAQRSVYKNICCAVCGWNGHGKYNLVRVHHVIPVSAGGESVESNTLLLCPNHHAIAHMLFGVVDKKYNGPNTPKKLKEALMRYESDWDEAELKVKEETIAILDKLRKPA